MSQRQADGLLHGLRRLAVEEADGLTDTQLLAGSPPTATRRRSPSSSSGTAGSSTASAGTSSGTTTTPRTRPRGRSSSWPGGPGPSARGRPSAAGCTGSPTGSPRRPGRPPSGAAAARPGPPARTSPGPHRPGLARPPGDARRGVQPPPRPVPHAVRPLHPGWQEQGRGGRRPRLEGRDRLQPAGPRPGTSAARLARRGVALSAILSGLAVAEPGVATPVPGGLVAAARAFATGRGRELPRGRDGPGVPPRDRRRPHCRSRPACSSSSDSAASSRSRPPDHRTRNSPSAGPNRSRCSAPARPEDRAGGPEADDDGVRQRPGPGR